MEIPEQTHRDLPPGPDRENPRFHPSLSAGGFDLGYATNLSEFLCAGEEFLSGMHRCWD
jgi:hypothetical protein